MSESVCNNPTPKLNLRGLRHELDQAAERSFGRTSKQFTSTLANTASASESLSEDDDSDVYDSDGQDSQTAESVGSSKVLATTDPLSARARNGDGFQHLERRICCSPSVRKDRSVGGGLVASNDFFTPRPNLPRPRTSSEVPPSILSSNGGAGNRASGLEAVRSNETQPHPDSLRGRYAVKATTRPQSAGDELKSLASFASPTMGTPRLIIPRDASNCSVGYIIKERMNNFTRRIQQSYNTERRVCRTAKSVSARDLELQLLEHGITPVYQPEIYATQPPPKPITDLSDVRSFLARSAPEGCASIQLHVRRLFKNDRIFPRFKLYLQDGNQMHFLLSARKRKKSLRSNYILSLDEDDISRTTGNYFGKLRSNLWGTEFWFYDKGARSKLGCAEASLNRRVELGVATYKNNPLGLNGPRKMTAIVPALDSDGKPYFHEPGPTGAHCLLLKYKCGQDLHKMVVMHNKKPTWNKKKMCYTLHFNGRVTRPSVKNFQVPILNLKLVKDGDEANIILQFGKVDKDAYNLDYKHPISALQAFVLSLTSVDDKIACE
ncbi:hypothetical protein R1sor_012824 [Riccia sorocarpa]|uniref:Tubby C-terminal domain-containing protein n=1 Tax=Riccia sorocarpa TaxID=122646 RepID=A0ABD3I4W1_9MARC